MSTPLSPTRLFQCDGCRATLPYDPAKAGKKVRCGGCGRILLIPNLADFESPPEKATPNVPRHIEFWCRVCDTRLVARSIDAGKRAKCPDCGAKNQVPQPVVPKAREEPPAMHGQQYGVWEVNKAPLSEDLRAKQPQLFPVYCRVCDTLMYAQPKHAGASLKCPDCGGLTVVKAPPPPEVKKSVLVPDGEEYQLIPEEVVRERPIRDDLVRIQEKARLDAETAARKREEERPKMPQWPTFQGVSPMLVRDPVPTWWVGLSAGSMATLGLLLASFTSGVGVTQIFALMCRIFACIGLLLVSGPLSAICCAIVAESSDGHKKLHAQPSFFFINCFPELFHIIVPLAVSLTPAMAMLALLPWQIGAVAAAGSLLVVYPVLLLSTFQEGTPMGVISPRIWGSVFKRPLHWLLFWGESTFLWALVGVTVVLMLRQAPNWPLATVPIALAGALVYFRVLGRFAWWLAESLPEED
ncbi:hypothetical protein [Bythopirellula goksoeyrii]|uniref:Mu-like prophage protein Com n=1 Tax=Bythopirellula goksoeyrii TaxID=1400387 RepID=A0A5B9QAS8_9BACT|nr:hypothetical protein [Bythopirellula goksoeyrii]QEG34859.1 Mu-like prophage protein Com [Bythopirellula goksoeyrii]